MAVREDEAQAVQGAAVNKGLPGCGVQAGALLAPLAATALLQIHHQAPSPSAREPPRDARTCTKGEEKVNKRAGLSVRNHMEHRGKWKGGGK